MKQSEAGMNFFFQKYLNSTLLTKRTLWLPKFGNMKCCFAIICSIKNQIHLLINKERIKFTFNFGKVNPTCWYLPRDMIIGPHR